MSTNVKDYSEYLTQLTEAKKRKSIAELRSAYEKSMEQLQQAESGLDGTYRQAKNAAAGQSAQSERNFAQYAAANGLTNGAAGQARLARGIALQSDLNALDREKLGKQAELDAQKAQAGIDYESGAAQAAAQAEADLAQSLYQERLRQEEAAYQLSRDAVEDAQWQKEMDFAIQKYWYDKGYTTSPNTQSSASTAISKTLRALANQVLRGEWGNGAERKERLTMAGYDYDQVQRAVDIVLAGG